MAAVDPTSLVEDPEDYHIGVSGAAFVRLVQRVVDLEGQAAATVPDDAPRDVDGRLDRHRAELEAIKRALNSLIRYIGAPIPETSPAPTVQQESYQ